MKIWIVLLIAALILPGALRKKAIPENLIESTVLVTVRTPVGSWSKINEGSGFVLSKTDTTTYIATCEHVVGESPELIVVSTDSKEYEARLVCSSEADDLAVIAIDAVLELEPLALTETGVGSNLYAAGYPIDGEELSHLYYDEISEKTVVAESGTLISANLDSGTIMLLNFPITAGGMSGGPLVDWKGEVVGVNSVAYRGILNAAGAVSTIELQKLCKENNIPYSHHVSTRLIRDGVLLVLFQILLCVSDEKVGAKGQNGKTREEENV